MGPRQIWLICLARCEEPLSALVTFDVLYLSRFQQCLQKKKKEKARTHCFLHFPTIFLIRDELLSIFLGSRPSRNRCSEREQEILVHKGPAPELIPMSLVILVQTKLIICRVFFDLYHVRHVQDMQQPPRKLPLARMRWRTGLEEVEDGHGRTAFYSLPRSRLDGLRMCVYTHRKTSKSNMFMLTNRQCSCYASIYADLCAFNVYVVRCCGWLSVA